MNCETNSVLVYGQSEDANAVTGRVYILYTGQHYDPLVGSSTTTTTPTTEQTEIKRFPVGANAETEAAALLLAVQQNADAARRAKQRRVKRIKCGGCEAILDDAAAFQSHCNEEAEHDDDFCYDCEEVEVSSLCSHVAVWEWSIRPLRPYSPCIKL